MAHQCAAISGADTNTKAVVEFCSTTADLSVPNLRSQTPTHHQVFWLMQPGADRKNKIHAPRGFLPSHGLPPTMAAFRRKAAQLQIQLRGKPRIPTGFLLSARHAAQQRTEDDTMYNILIYYISHLQNLVNLFLAPNHKMCRGSRGLPPSCRGAGMLPQASLLYFDDMDIRQLIVRLPGDDIGKQGDIRILQPLGGRGDGDVDAVVGHVSNAIGVPLGDN